MTTLSSLDALGAAAACDPIVARMYRGETLNAPPKLDGTDAWPVSAGSVADPADLTSAKTTFATSYVIGNTWVGKVTLLPLEVGDLRFVVHEAIVTMDISADRKSATNGTIAGVLSADEYGTALVKLLQQSMPQLCGPSPTADSVLAQIRGASDILVDGTQDPQKVCDGISLGLGFEARRVELGPIAEEPQPEPDPCEP